MGSSPQFKGSILEYSTPSLPFCFSPFHSFSHISFLRTHMMLLTLQKDPVQSFHQPNTSAGHQWPSLSICIWTGIRTWAAWAAVIEWTAVAKRNLTEEIVGKVLGEMGRSHAEAGDSVLWKEGQLMGVGSDWTVWGTTPLELDQRDWGTLVMGNRWGRVLVSFSLAVVKHPTKATWGTKDLFCSQFQVIVHYCGEIKAAGTSSSRSHDIPGQEQRAQS